MEKSPKNVVLMTSLTLLTIWSLVSIVQGQQQRIDSKYGADCGDYCFYSIKGFSECYHESGSDACLTTKCLVNLFRAASCPEDDTWDCDYSWVNGEWRIEQVERSSSGSGCTSDDWSTGWEPWPCDDWTSCEWFSSTAGILGRCFSTGGCSGGILDTQHLWGRYKCD